MALLTDGGNAIPVVLALLSISSSLLVVAGWLLAFPFAKFFTSSYEYEECIKI
jgi:hypothetical protein